jgi:small-conductance mechanosensitive channel
MISFNQQLPYHVLFELSVLALVLLITGIIASISRAVIGRVMKSSSPYLTSRLETFVFLFIWVTGIIFGLSQVGFFVRILELLLALAGIGLIAVSYPIMQNIVSRSFMNLQRQYKVGDLISIGGFKGKVIEITDLNTVLLDKGGNQVFVPNVNFLKEVWVKHRASGYEVDLPIVIKKEVDVIDFERELLKLLKDLNKYFKKEPNIVTTEAEEKTTELSLMVYLKDPEQKSLVVSEIDEKTKKLVGEFEEKIKNDKKEAELREIKKDSPK